MYLLQVKLRKLLSDSLVLDYDLRLFIVRVSGACLPLHMLYQNVYFWRALARQHPILYNSEKKAESVRCKIEDMRSRLCFFISVHSGLLVNAHGYFDRFSRNQARSARNQGHDKRGEIWMSPITCGSIHKGHEWFNDYSRGRQEIFICLAVLLCEQFCRLANGAKISIKS